MRRTEAQFAEQRAHAYELRVRGLTYADIALALGVPTSTIYRWCTDLVAARVTETQTEMLAFELDRLDRYLVKLEEQIEDGRAVSRAIETALRVGERRAKVLGLDMPTKIETTVTEVTTEDIALAELIREAQAASAGEEARIKDGGN